jgi:transcription elongation factor GreA
MTRAKARPEELVLTEDRWRQVSDQLVALRTQRAEKVAAYAELARREGPDEFLLHYSQAEIAFLGRRIAQLEDTLANANLVDGAGGPADTVRFGSRVRVRWEDGAEEEYVVVTPPELELRSGHISCESPVGRTILGRHVGEHLAVPTPSGPLGLQVVAVAQAADEQGGSAAA